MQYKKKNNNSYLLGFAPKFTSQIQNKTIYTDSNAFLSCGQVDGSPKPTINWSKRKRQYFNYDL